MSIIIVFLSIALLIVLITGAKVNPFLALLVVSIICAFSLGMSGMEVVRSVQKGMGDMLGSLVIIIVTGAMLGKLVAESGAAEKIASSMTHIFGQRHVHWALMLTGFIIGIPLFYTVGFVLVMPIIFAVSYRYKLSPLFVGVPMLASLSVTHGFLPPHPSPVALVAQFKADMSTTLLYGFIIAIPTVIIAGPLFARTLKKSRVDQPLVFEPAHLPEKKMPSLSNSLLSSLLPVVILAISAIFDGKGAVLNFITDPAMVMLIALTFSTFSLGVFNGMKIPQVMNIYTDAVKDVAMLLLIIAGAGALKQVLVDSGISNEIATGLNSLETNPLILGWGIACVIRVCVGSATVAGLTAAGIVLPMVTNSSVDPNLMVLSIGAGSLMFSHVNDTGFWLFKEYFNLGIKQTIMSWSLMETLVAICGLFGVLILNLFIK